GSTTVSFTATDECGNSSTTQATFIIEDTTAPTIGTPASDVTVECDGAGNTTDLMGWLNNNGGALATDLCGDVTWSNNYSGLSDDCGLTGSATVTFTATDSCGNASTTTATFIIEDTTDPVLITPAQNLTVECDGLGNSVQLNAWLATAGGAIASDTCGSIVWTNNFTTLSDGCGMTGSATVTFTATDECGNSRTETPATFTIEDTTSPVVTIPAQDMTVECDGLGNGAERAAWLASNGGASASDTCSGVVWSNNFTTLSDGCGMTGSATVTVTATAECGNSVNTLATFTIADTTAPVIVTPAADITVECDGSGNTADYQAWLASNGGAAATDSCGTVTWSYAIEDTNTLCGLTGYVIVNFTATDECGNS